MKIAVIAHDGKKAEMVAFLNRHMDFLKSVGTEIVAELQGNMHRMQVWKLNAYYQGRWEVMLRLPHW